MQKIFVDTNIVLDLLSKRKDFFEEAQELFSMADRKEIQLYISSLTFANVHYLLSREHSLENTRNILIKFKLLVEVLPLDDKIIELSLTSEFKDFEDGIQYFTAIENQLFLILSRNKKDFKPSKLPVLTAKEFLNSNIN